MRIIFDVGANTGSSSLHYTKDFGDLVYAFEPHPGFCSMIESNKQMLGISDGYHIIQKAVSDFNGLAAFHIYKSEDCSSLSRVSDSVEKTWPNLKIKMDCLTTIEVEVITLKKFIIENKIKQIDYLHCDAQGHDLNVLKGLGEYWRIVNEGVIEVVKSNDVALYKGQYILDDVRKWMSTRGFEITDEVLNNPEESSNELNVYFSNKNFQPLA